MPRTEPVESVREIGPGLKQLAVAIEQAPARLGREVQAAQDRLAGAIVFALALGLVVGLAIGRLSGRFRE